MRGKEIRKTMYQWCCNVWPELNAFKRLLLPIVTHGRSSIRRTI